ncbi:MAG TPA: dihydrodipicolinate synthase family protein [Vicinamibacterales bacterium]|nr:dihydrodipicolinate synthase family protein [Vicinamibacterales bacterium]
MPSRRELLKAVALAPFMARGLRASGAADAPRPMRGVFIILNTPFTRTGDVDWADLEREVAFVEAGGCHGVVWPQGSSGVTTLTRDERLRGMEVLARAVKGRRLTLVLGVQGRDTAEMLEYAKRADALGSDAVIAMPPTTGRSLDDYRAYFRALGAATSRPSIVQTSGGAKDLSPTVELIVDLAREFPHMAYVKEESEPLIKRMQGEIAARPTMKGIFGASLGTGFLYEMRLGLDGIITGMGMYADLMGRMWDLHERGQHDQVRDAYSKFLLMRNLNEAIPGTDLYVMKMRGVFQTTTRRTSAPVAGAAAKLTEFTPSPMEREEIEFRFAALKPYLIANR